jgi:hypothetical protein
VPAETHLRALFGVAAWRVLCRSERSAFMPILRNRELDLDIRELEARNKALQRDLLKDVTLEMDKPPLDVLGQAMHFLKARSVNVFHDLDTIQKAREAAKGSSPFLR